MYGYPTFLYTLLLLYIITYDDCTPSSSVVSVIQRSPNAPPSTNQRIPPRRVHAPPATSYTGNNLLQPPQHLTTPFISPTTLHWLPSTSTPSSYPINSLMQKCLPSCLRSPLMSSLHTKQLGDGLNGTGLTYLPTHAHNYTVLWLHGLGDTADGWSFLPSSFTSNPFNKNTKYILPTAPTRPITLNGGIPMPAWADVYEISPDAPEDFNGYTLSTDRVHKLISNEITKGGIPSTCIAIGGFSQGAALAYMAALTYPLQLGGAVVLSGWLPVWKQLFVDDTKKRKQLDVLQFHGADDFIVPKEFAELSIQKLKELTEFNIKYEEVEGMGHSTSPHCINSVGAFFNQLFIK